MITVSIVSSFCPEPVIMQTVKFTVSVALNLKKKKVLNANDSVSSV